MLKRSFDFIASAIGLSCLLPVFLIIAFWVKLDSKGPIFFRQVRIGRNGVPFIIHKFRTMHTNAESEGRLTIGSDSRITHSGHFLRRTKLDELPQLIDVLLGDMSLVGPRPEVSEFMELYREDVRSNILSVKPGITDRASIEMVDENTLLSGYADPKQAYIEIIMPIKAKISCEYVDKQNFIDDLKIIFLTLWHIAFR
ncbi:sugar transferase [Psychrobacter frigidicola]|uniref:Sugar transferase n=1 Tax=Psychrobacter frigidicola TaxID=45611 RepID=A0A5C7A377_9GAMM|nr:sugar transferase [Psychrobacter frigidicola]TXD97841.1 sugar transferase [Psychrobacter frigidicola]